MKTSTEWKNVVLGCRTELSTARADSCSASKLPEQVPEEDELMPVVWTRDVQICAASAEGKA